MDRRRGIVRKTDEQGQGGRWRERDGQINR
jgi:hypothetical protein